jgi:hypothetical protein
MGDGLNEADWSTRREIIRALVKQVEVSEEEIRIVYRVNTVPFARAPQGAFAQDCPRRPDTFPLDSRLEPAAVGEGEGVDHLRGAEFPAGASRS